MDATLGPSFFVRSSAIPKPVLFNLVARRRARSRSRLEWRMKIRGFGHCFCDSERSETSSSLEEDAIFTPSWSLRELGELTSSDPRLGCSAPAATSEAPLRWLPP